MIEASKADPHEIQADFLLGLGYALVARDAKNAKRHFAECVKRSPAHISAPNNLALAEIGHAQITTQRRVTGRRHCSPHRLQRKSPEYGPFFLIWLANGQSTRRPQRSVEYPTLPLGFPPVSGDTNTVSGGSTCDSMRRTTLPLHQRRALRKWSRSPTPSRSRAGGD